MKAYHFPFSAIVGQPQMKRALILNLVNPGLGGVLIAGEKGTGKSTAVRGLTELLPERLVSADCPFSCPIARPEWFCDECAEMLRDGRGPRAVATRMRVVELPLGATEDRVAGSLDVEHVLASGQRRFDPGILARANGNILYVDEINLLEDHIVDLLLDSAAMGVNYVEREGVSFTHPARFVLVGSMNPEEGELRPQLLDRFALSVSVHSESDEADRAEVLRRRLHYEADPEAFCRSWTTEDEALSRKVTSAAELVRNVRLPDEVLGAIARTCIELEVDGHRSDLALARAAVANAAFRGSSIAEIEDVEACAALALDHRMRRQPFEERGIDEHALHAALRVGNTR